MTIPPFPSQDLAKLVLGYLAEEQLMTAYDEFLQASPYLDALRNEYDRIFMTSLKNILAEYRAVKIYVETCKPFLLRKKLLQCTNLLDVVKILVSYTDVNKLQGQDVSNEKLGQSNTNSSTVSKENECEVCNSLNLTGCVCKQNKPGVHTIRHAETSQLDSSVETTSLEDLPGNQVTNRKKHQRVSERTSVSETNLNATDNTRQSTSAYNSVLNGNNQSAQTHSSENSSVNLSNIVKVTDTAECRDKIEEFNNILNKVCNNKSNADTRLFSIPETDALGSRVSSASFQEFATGVGGHDSRNVPVPDSSTSENTIAQTFANTRDINNISSEVPKDVNEHSEIQLSNKYPYPRIKAKSNDQKIKIISDIKVDSPYTAMTNATSTPLMQTIVINGTPAYKQKLPANNNYTKDEIMAMPTIIVVPTSGPPQKLTQTQPVLSQKIKKVKMKTPSTKKLLGPLVIDVSSSPVEISNKDSDTTQPGLGLQSSGMETGLIRTVDVTKNASVPKDNIIPGSTQTNTPQILPPVRKSSSTPRRTHIRVLDFNTPRRILHETINEKVPEKNNDKPMEIVVSGSPNVVFPKTDTCSNSFIDMSTVKLHRIETCHISNLNENKDTKKSNWDADLRALAIASEKAVQVPVKKPRVRNTKKKLDKSGNPPEKKKELEEKKKELEEKKKELEEKTDTKKPVRCKRKCSPKGKKSKRRKLEEEEEQYNNSSMNTTEAKVAVKPTFNVVAADLKSSKQDSLKASNTQNKSNNEDDSETPETERLSLQNEIGAKLNISDLLETPYKQALYDIQMETPKFIGSVLSGEPISDIKIMNIPTPRFFDTPKPTQATPSYASRATDYSSGGSYYKPDEQDYLRIPDLECPVTSSKEVHHIDLPKQKENDVKKSTRPVRKCTKNVSYKATRGKGTDDKVETASSCSDTVSVNSSFENSKEHLKTPKTPKDNNKSKLHSKSEAKKKTESGRKRKSPLKKDKSNTFMKIKPRRLTPTKENNRRRKTLPANSPKTQVKKKAGGKEKIVQTTPLVTSAPTKSRRKSSTPRKLHCTKQFTSESSADSPESNVKNKNKTVTQTLFITQTHDSDTEQLALRWSDDGSQDAKPVSECEDITKIKEYIESSSVHNKIDYNDGKGTLQVDLIKRGFDAETAKIIERDLLDIPEVPQSHQINVQIPETGHSVPIIEKSNNTDQNVTNEMQTSAEDDDDDLVLSVYECNEESDNYITYNSEGIDTPTGDPVTLRDAWSMEVCIEDGVPIRLRATAFNLLFDNVPQDVETGYSFRETEVAVSSISNIEKLYTPLKDRRTQCYEIFDSTLTSLDTPLKLSSPKDIMHETTEIEIVVEEEKVENKDKADRKRKRLQTSNSTEESLNENKNAKPEAQYLFNSTNIQNIDIESVLKKLHGPSEP